MDKFKEDKKAGYTNQAQPPAVRKETLPVSTNTNQH